MVTASIADSVLLENEADAGGGIYVGENVTLDVRQSSLRDNWAISNAGHEIVTHRSTGKPAITLVNAEIARNLKRQEIYIESVEFGKNCGVQQSPIFVSHVRGKDPGFYLNYKIRF